MPYYALIAYDAPGTMAMRLKLRDIHRQRLADLDSRGDLLTAGPLTHGTEGQRVQGSLIVAQFKDINEAQAWIDADPYVKSGVYRKTQAYEYGKAYPKDV